MTESASSGSALDLTRQPWRQRISERWASLPALGRAFAGLAVLDTVGRIVGVIQPPIFFAGDLVLILTEFFPRVLVILLPALVLGRRPDAARASPLVFRGAVLLAVAELVTPQLTRIFFETIAAQNLAIWTSLRLLYTVATAVAWIMIGTGLRRLSPPSASPKVARYANRAAGVFGVVAVLQGFATLTAPGFEPGGLAGLGLFRLSTTFFVLESLALAFVARIVIRGFDDPRRPAAATRLAAAAFAALGVAALVDVVIGLADIVWAMIGPIFVLGYSASGPQGGIDVRWGNYSYLGGPLSVLVISGFLLSFALGLADPHVDRDELVDA